MRILGAPIGALFVYNEDMILGIDEAGRGPWAGPLVVGAVILGGAQIEGLTDSKKLTKKKRERLYDEITGHSTAYASGWVTAAELDEIGMSAALRLATRRAVEQITVLYSEIIIDGTINFLADTGKGKYVQTMPKADLLVPSVSAASIIAKVERDHYMTKLGEEYPQYGFGAHAGYGVAKHRAAIEEYGVTPEHRLSFAPLAKYRTTSRSLLSSSQISKKSEHSVSRSGQAIRIRETSKSLGDRAEEVVAEYLQREGHKIIDRNWRTKFCEIDIISRYKDIIYFTEVKYRRNTVHGDGLAAITAKKRRQMKFAAEYFILKHQINDCDLHLAVADLSGTDFALRAWLPIH